MRTTALAVITICLVLAACGGGSHPGEARHSPGPAAAPLSGLSTAVAVLAPTAGSNVAGVLRFKERDGKMLIVGDLTGLSANARHAIHIHEFGDGSAADGTAAGGHYNPEGHPHAGLDTAHRHAGDLGNLLADAAGACHLEISVGNLTIAGARNPILGRSVVLHAKEDDLSSQPSGNAGPRIAVGVIGVAKP